MDVRVLDTVSDMGVAAAEDGATVIRDAIATRGQANIIVATGASQFETLGHLARQAAIDWTRVTGFHLDEYIGLPITHPASFRLYLWQRFVSRLPVPMRAFHFLNAERNPQAECLRVGEIIRQHPIDVAFIGIGENAHIAFNDPPADFETDQPYVVVTLDEACRRQQLGEGWFPTLADVPGQAVSMSVRQILRSERIICSVPDTRKSRAVRNAVEGPLTPDVPASILQTHGQTTIYLDRQAASELREGARA